MSELLVMDSGEHGESSGRLVLFEELEEKVGPESVRLRLEEEFRLGSSSRVSGCMSVRVSPEQVSEVVDLLAISATPKEKEEMRKTLEERVSGETKPGIDLTVVQGGNWNTSVTGEGGLQEISAVVCLGVGGIEPVSYLFQTPLPAEREAALKKQFESEHTRTRDRLVNQGVVDKLGTRLNKFRLNHKSDRAVAVIARRLRGRYPDKIQEIEGLLIEQYGPIDERVEADFTQTVEFGPEGWLKDVKDARGVTHFLEVQVIKELRRKRDLKEPERPADEGLETELWDMQDQVREVRKGQRDGFWDENAISPITRGSLESLLDLLTVQASLMRLDEDFFGLESSPSNS